MTISYYRTCNSNKGINASLNLHFNFPSLVFDKCFDLSALLPFEVLHFLPYVAAKIAYNLLNCTSVVVVVAAPFSNFPFCFITQ